MDYKARLVAFYEAHGRQDKVADADDILVSFAGREDELFDALQDMYGPPVPPQATVEEAAPRAPEPHPTVGGPATLGGEEPAPSEAAPGAAESLGPPPPPSLAAALQALTAAHQGLGRDAPPSHSAFLSAAEGFVQAARAFAHSAPAAPVAPAPEPRAVLQRYSVRTEEAADPAPRAQGPRGRSVFDVVPIDGTPNVVADLVAARCRPGDVVVLHPGVYVENITIACDITLRCSREAADTVVLQPGDPTSPVLLVRAGRAELSGLRLQADRPAGALEHSTPLCSVSGGAELALSGVGLVSGGAVGTGAGTVLRLERCTVRRAPFAAVYATDRAHLAVQQSSLLECDAGVRVKAASFLLEKSEVRDPRGDGVVLHGSCRGSVAHSTVLRAGAHGVLLSASCEVSLTALKIVEAGGFGVMAPPCAAVTATQCVVERCSAGAWSRSVPQPRR